MAEMWYYTSEGRQMDPVSFGELKRLVGTGVLKPTDMVWKEGLPRWVRASSQKELFPDPTAALDQFFLSPKQATAGAETAAAADSTLPAAPTRQRDFSRDDDDETRSPKRRRRAADDYRDRPRRTAPVSGGSSFGIVVALILGGLVVAGALVVGIIIIVVAKKERAVEQAVQVKMAPAFPPAEIKANPEPNLAFVNGVLTYDTPALNQAAKNDRTVSFRKGFSYDISLRGERGPNLVLNIFDRNNFLQLLEQRPGPDLNFRWAPKEDGEFRVEIVKMNLGPPSAVTVTIKEAKQPAPIGKNEAPLPADVMTGKGSMSIGMVLLPDQEHIVKFRVKAGRLATIKATPASLKNADLNLYVYKESDNALIVADEGPEPIARVEFNLQSDEFVRVRIHNASKTANVTRCTVFYDVGK